MVLRLVESIIEPRIEWTRGTQRDTRLCHLDGYFVGIVFPSDNQPGKWGYTYMPRNRVSMSRYPTQICYQSADMAMRALLQCAMTDWYDARQMKLPLDTFSKVSENSLAQFRASGV